MDKIKKAMPLSSSATGINKAETNIQTVKGVQERCEKISLEIIPHMNKLIVSYDKVYLNSDNEQISKPVKKTINVLDVPEIGEVQIDSNLNEVEGSYIKLSDEALNVTDWNTQLGNIVITAMIDFVKTTEGYNI